MIDERIAEWLASGDTGTSSMAIMLWLSARKISNNWGASTPSDPDDLGRCCRLLERIPEWQDRIGEMAEAGGLWPTFSKRWTEIVESFKEECGGRIPSKGDYWRAPQTYELMRDVRDQAYAADRPGFTEVRASDTMTIRFAKDSPLAEHFAVAAEQMKRNQ